MVRTFLPVEYWRGVGKNNIISSKLNQVRNHATRVLEGRQPAMIVHGGSGMGKNHVVADVIKSAGAGDQVLMCNPQHPRDLLQAFFDATHGRVNNPLIILFDEADLVFRSQPCLNILKMALDPTGPRWFQDFAWKIETEDEEGKFVLQRGRGTSLKARVLILTNTYLHEVNEAKLAVHTDALLLRCPPIELAGDDLAKWEYAVWLALTSDLITAPIGRSMPLLTRAKAICWFTDHVYDLKQVSVRTLVKVAEAHAMAESEEALNDDLALLLKAKDERLEIDGLPQEDWVNLRFALSQTEGDVIAPSVEWPGVDSSVTEIGEPADAH